MDTCMHSIQHILWQHDSTACIPWLSDIWTSLPRYHNLMYGILLIKIAF